MKLPSRPLGKGGSLQKVVLGQMDGCPGAKATTLGPCLPTNKTQFQVDRSTKYGSKTTKPLDYNREEYLHDLEKQHF